MAIPRFKPKSISATVEKLTKPLFSKRGFGQSTMINNWSKIVGDELAKHASPDKIVFPKNERNNGILYININSPAFAIELQHKETQLIENINMYFGYLAVKTIKIKQGSLSIQKDKTNRKKRVLTGREKKELDSELKFVKDPDLKKALLALGTEIKASQQK